MVNSGYSPAEKKILEAAKNVFIKKGMHGARMQEIAEEAGINKALLHYYFRNKKMLFLAIFKSEFSRFGPRLFQLFDSDVSMEDKLRQVVAAYIDLLASNPYLPVFIIHEMHQNPELMSDLKSTLQDIKSSKIVEQLKEGIVKGFYVPLVPEQFFTNLLGWCIFPFLAKPMIMQMFLEDERSFTVFLEERKRIIPELFLQSIKKQ
jgi:AcrR family transcriptional regulator